MTRSDMINYLKKHNATAQRLATEFERNIKAVEEDLSHIRTTLRNDPEYQLMIRPAECELCGYTFSNNSSKAPSKCPECGKEKIKAPMFRIERK